MSEIWKPVVGYEGLYEVSELGNVRRYDTKKLLYLEPCKGYKRVGLRKNGLWKRTGIHRLVLEAFIGPPPTPKHETNHQNGNKADNALINLEWATKSQNALHACRVLGTHKQKGSGHGQHKLDESDVLAIIARSAAGEPQQSIANDFNVVVPTISLIARGHTWKHLPRPAQPDRRQSYGSEQTVNLGDWAKPNWNR